MEYNKGLLRELKMKNNENYQMMCSELYSFKSNFQRQQDLFRIFLHEYINITEYGEHILEDEYISRNCLYTLVQLLNELINENIKLIEKIYFNIETNYKYEK